jgi:hypothetical protein|tara:strand:- start:251 stop:466 length:216 start_codon:yes stop_codon:yes gene_type:complete
MSYSRIAIIVLLGMPAIVAKITGFAGLRTDFGDLAAVFSDKRGQWLRRKGCRHLAKCWRALSSVVIQRGAV